jgi:ubiquinone/menaquinone biosynthesis C-methylase UbiE
VARCGLVSALMVSRDAGELEDCVMNDVQNKQEDVRNFWDKRPCDSDVSELARGNVPYYEEIEKDRYQHQSHINRIMDWISWQGKRVLEIGTGVGTDARNIIGRGGFYQGINVDQGSVDATVSALKVYGLSGNVTKCSATELIFPDNSFDIVYSFGVLHHIPDVNRAVAEISRVLKPGGELLVMVYNRSSINYRLEILVLRKLFVRLLRIPGAIRFFGMLGFPEAKLRRHAEIFASGKLSAEDWLSRNTDGPDNPYSLVYDTREIEQLLSDFHILKNEVFFFDSRHWGAPGRLVPAALVQWLGRRWGWHRVVYGVKPK